MKYVIVEPIPGGAEAAILFPDVVQHSEVAGRLKAVSAGFCNVPLLHVGRGVQCWGESASLKLRARPGDAEVVERSLRR